VRPAPIPNDEILPGSQRIVVGPPRGHELTGNIRAAEVCMRHVEELGGVPVLSARCVLEPGDLEALQAGGAVWVHFYGGQLLPFDVEVRPPLHIRR
jgi:hypothetical protein